MLSYHPQPGVIAAQRNLMECSQCGALNRLPDATVHGLGFCHRCDNRLHYSRPRWDTQMAAYTIAAILLFLISNLFPFLAIEMADQRIEISLLSSVAALINRDQLPLAALVFMSIFLLPLMELFVYGYLLLGQRAGQRWPARRFLLAALCRVQQWNLLEVFLLGVLISSVKLEELGHIEPGAGLFGFLALVVAMGAINVTLNRRALWQQINGNDFFVTHHRERMRGCHQCCALVGASLSHCPRCHASVKRRRPDSVIRTMALLCAAALLYLPANLLPMMRTSSLGSGEQSDTIFSGTVYLFHQGQWPLALIVFVASILVPICKIGVLSYLLWRVNSPKATGMMKRMRLYRLTEQIGRWSMVDVYVVILLIALVQFGTIASVEPGGAALAFGAVVVLTMLAAEAFDPRLLWDSAEQTVKARVIS